MTRDEILNCVFERYPSSEWECEIARLEGYKTKDAQIAEIHNLALDEAQLAGHEDMFRRSRRHRGFGRAICSVAAVRKARRDAAEAKRWPGVPREDARSLDLITRHGVGPEQDILSLGMKELSDANLLRLFKLWPNELERARKLYKDRKTGHNQPDPVLPLRHVITDHWMSWCLWTMDSKSRRRAVAAIVANNRGYDLSLMPVTPPDGLSDTGESLVIVALVGDDLHIRIFDDVGQIIVNKAEAELVNGQDLTDLKVLLNEKPFPDESSLSDERRQEIARMATFISGHTQIGQALKDATRRPKGLFVSKKPPGWYDGELFVAPH